jgi:hypothetical protein
MSPLAARFTPLAFASLLLLVAAFALMSSVAPADAASVAPGVYKGRTDNDGRILFRVAGRRASAISGIVPTVCLELGGSYDSRIGYEYFRPPGSFPIGGTRKAKAMQPAALNGDNKLTKNYEVGMGPSSRSTVKGRLDLNYVFLTLGFPNVTYLWTCSSNVRFTARKR